MNNITIFGASGGIGLHAVKHALNNNYNVTAYLRNPKKLTIEHENLMIVKGELNDYDAMKKALDGADAVIWCVGIPMKRSYPHKFSLEGHEILLRIMEENNIKRLIDWSTTAVTFKKDKKSIKTTIPPLLAGLFMTQAKQELNEIADLIKKSNLEWTIVRFLAPTNGKFKGNAKVSFGDNRLNFNISRSDIAYFMVKQLNDKTYIKSMPLIGS